MVFKHIQTELKNGVATLTLNRAPLNWLNIEMMEEINNYLSSLMAEKGLKLLVVQAAGKAYSVGVEVADHLGDLATKMIQTFHQMFRLMDALKVPSLAVVMGLPWEEVANWLYIATWCLPPRRQNLDSQRYRSSVFSLRLPPWFSLGLLAGKKPSSSFCWRYHQRSGSLQPRTGE